MLAKFGSLGMTAARATLGVSARSLSLGTVWHLGRRAISLSPAAPCASRTTPLTCPRLTCSPKRPRGALGARLHSACATRCVALAMPTCRTEGHDAHSAGRTGWSSFVTDGGFSGAPSWPLALRCLVARPGRAVTGRPYVYMLRDAWYLLEVRAPDSLRIARRVLHEALVGWGVRPSVFCRLCV